MIDFIASGAAFLLVFMIMMLFAAMLPARRRVVLGAALAATAATFVIPFGEAGIFFYIRSAMGHFSAALPVAAGFSLASFALRRPAVARADEALFAGVVAALGLVLYGSATGYLPFDLYRLGYRPEALAIILAVALGCAVLVRSSMTTAWVTASAILWLSGAMTSANAFDAVIDAPTWFSALVLSLNHCGAALTGRGLPFWGYRMSSRPKGRVVNAIHA